MMAFICVTALALVLAGDSAWSSHPSESARNQYEAREDRPQPKLLIEATDHRPEVHMSHQPGFIKNSTGSGKQPDLQVGCGDGFIQEKLQKHNSELDKNKVPSKAFRKSRRKRSYTPWTREISYNVPYQSISVWQPPVYQISRPYFIPIYGVPGRIPIYYPPQPLYINAGAPKDNPVKKPFHGPPYLPPRDPAETTTMAVDDRFNGGDNFDDRPVWDTSNNQPPRRPQRPFTTTTEVIPTRRTRPPGAPRVPGLVHNPTDPEDVNTIEVDNNSGRFTTPTPQAVRPPVARPVQSTPRPPSGPNDPGRCVWAIISCCSSSSTINYNCFEQSGCEGAFWDANPCDNEFAQAAISAALNYYNKK